MSKPVSGKKGIIINAGSYGRKGSGTLHSLSQRFFATCVAIILLTTLLAGVPAYVGIRTELDKQAWKRVLDGGHVTMTLLETEKTRLENLAALVAQRPTLQALARQGNIEALNEYLQAFRETVALDILVLNDPSGKVLTASTGGIFSLKAPLLQETVYQELAGAKPQLAMLVSKQVPDVEPQEAYITAGIILDERFAKKLAEETGFEHSFLVDEQRVTTTLKDSPSVVTVEAIRCATISGMTETAYLDFQNLHCYVAVFPLLDNHGEVIGISEVLLPIDDLIAANRSALLVLVLSTFFVTAAASGLAGYFVRWLKKPLQELSDSAIKIGQGDLNSPIPIPESPVEIATLATTLEKSRIVTLHALEELSQAKAWSETLIQSVVEGIVTIDRQGKVTSFNQGAEQITGWKRSEVLGMPVNQALPLAEETVDITQKISPSGGAQRIHIKNRTGGEVALAITSARLHAPESGAHQMAMVLRDISEEESAQRLRSYFLANISHEFRTPLTALNASVELLLEDIEELSLAEIAELLKSIHLSVTGLQTLIDNLLESTSIEAGRFRIRPRATDLGDLITNALQVMRPLIERRKQNVTLVIPTQIPTANVDPTRLTQVLVNLLSNASKYSPMESTIALQLKLMNKRTLRVSISDQGPGIPLSERSKLYQRFIRLGETESAQFGIGLGLSVVKTIIEAHHGKVGMEEKPGGGSVFWFTIPIQEAG